MKRKVNTIPFGSDFIRPACRLVVNSTPQHVCLIALLALGNARPPLHLAPEEKLRIEAEARTVAAALAWLKWAEVKRRRSSEIEAIKRNVAKLLAYMDAKLALGAGPLAEAYPELKEETDAVTHECRSKAGVVRGWLPERKAARSDDPYLKQERAFERLSDDLTKTNRTRFAKVIDRIGVIFKRENDRQRKAPSEMARSKSAS